MKVIRTNVRVRKLRATVAKERGYLHTSQSVWNAPASNQGVLDGVLAGDSRTMRKKVRNPRDTNANRKWGGHSTYYRPKEGFGQ